MVGNCLNLVILSLNLDANSETLEHFADCFLCYILGYIFVLHS